MAGYRLIPRPLKRCASSAALASSPPALQASRTSCAPAACMLSGCPGGAPGCPAGPPACPAACPDACPAAAEDPGGSLSHIRSALFQSPAPRAHAQRCGLHVPVRHAVRAAIGVQQLRTTSTQDQSAGARCLFQRRVTPHMDMSGCSGARHRPAGRGAAAVRPPGQRAARGILPLWPLRPPSGRSGTGPARAPTARWRPAWHGQQNNPHRCTADCIAPHECAVHSMQISHVG